MQNNIMSYTMPLDGLDVTTWTFPDATRVLWWEQELNLGLLSASPSY